MKERVEELLRTRGRALDGPVLSPARRARVQVQLEGLAREEEAPDSRGPRSWRFGLIAAAAASVLALLAWTLGGRDGFGELAVEVALLDPLGRPLGHVERSVNPPPLPRRDAILFEVEAVSDGFVFVVLYGPFGARHVPRVGAPHAIEGGELASITLPLEALPARSAGLSVVGAILVSSTRAVPPERLRSACPDRVASAGSDDFLRSLVEIARELERELGCSARVYDFVLESR